ncbi:hypothetical protein K438DRAFT_262832 [Mycena galopus ATCC 62051]|nr:hypothetical protein K438DRAFT_262832 [Mycena galopus ATCC 62051]
MWVFETFPVSMFVYLCSVAHSLVLSPPHRVQMKLVLPTLRVNTHPRKFLDCAPDPVDSILPPIRGGHGGTRKGAGRPHIHPPAKTPKSNTLGSSASHVTVPLSHPNSTPAFFRTRNTNCPVPLGSAGAPQDTVSSAPISSLSSQEFEEVNAHLQYVDDNNEYADIAAGDRAIDESLADSVSDNSESNAAAAEAETQSSQPTKKSALHDYLKAVRARLQEEETKHGKPLCYKRGDFFDFSEAIFIRDKSDVLAVQAVLKQHGIDWDYAKQTLLTPMPRFNAQLRRPAAHSSLTKQRRWFSIFSKRCGRVTYRILLVYPFTISWGRTVMVLTSTAPSEGQIPLRVEFI